MHGQQIKYHVFSSLMYLFLVDLVKVELCGIERLDQVSHVCRLPAMAETF